MRKTRQLEILKGEIGKMESFFSTEDLFKASKKKDLSLGIATVYRFLRDLSDRSELHSYVCDRKTVYSKNKSSHCHFICKKCGKVQHVDVKSLDFLGKSVGGKVCHFQIDVTGTCNACLKK